MAETQAMNRKTPINWIIKRAAKAIKTRWRLVFSPDRAARDVLQAAYYDQLVEALIVSNRQLSKLVQTHADLGDIIPLCENIDRVAALLDKIKGPPPPPVHPMCRCVLPLGPPQEEASEARKRPAVNKGGMHGGPTGPTMPRTGFE